MFIDIPNGALPTMPTPTKPDTDQSLFHGSSSIVTKFQLSVLCTELLNVLTAGGLTPSNSEFDQVAKAINAMQAKTMVTPSGQPVRMTDNSTLVLPAGLRLPDATRTTIIEIVANTNVSLLSNGLGGLDTGSPAANSVYYLWIVRNPSTGVVSGVLSLSDTAPTLPSGFTQKQLYPVDFATDANSGTPRFLLKTLISHTRAIFQTPLTVWNNLSVSSSFTSPTVMNLATLFGNNVLTALFKINGSGENSSGQLNFYPSGIATPSGQLVAYTVIDSDRETNTVELLVDSTKAYKLARQGGLSVYIFVTQQTYKGLS